MCGRLDLVRYRPITAVTEMPGSFEAGERCCWLAAWKLTRAIALQVDVMLTQMEHTDY